MSVQATLAVSSYDPASPLPGAKIIPHVEGRGLPIFIKAVDDQLTKDLGFALKWLATHQVTIDDIMYSYGGIVLRGFPFADTSAFSKFVSLFPGSGFDYSAGGSPRNQINEQVYESTHAPQDSKIKLHQEMAYLPRYPKSIAFYCQRPAGTGGETTVGDMRKLRMKIAPKFWNAINERGVRYAYNFRNPERSAGHPRLDMYHRTWTDAFYTKDKDKVARECNAMGIKFEWKPDGSVTTTYNSAGLITHPRTGEKLWFNSIAPLFPCAENWGKPIKDLYENHYSQNGLERPVVLSHNDGNPIDENDALSLYEVLDGITVSFPWHAGDIMILDNLAVGHGRAPFTGERNVQVAFLR